MVSHCFEVVVVIQVTSSPFFGQYQWLLPNIISATGQIKETELLFLIAEAMMFMYTQ